MTEVHDGWSLREALGHTWRWYVDASLPAAGNNVADAATAAAAAPGWHPARVPGSIVRALVDAGEAPTPYVGRQSRSVEWTADRHWVLRRPLDPPPLADDERAVLELDGVDPGGRVLVDGTEVGRTAGLYRRLRADVTDLLRRPGPHRLAVVVDPVPDSEPQVGRTEDVRVHAPRMNYGWDFCPRLPHQGIWRPVRLVVGRLHLHDVVLATETAADLGSARVHLAAVVEGTPYDADALTVGVTDPHGQVVAETTVAVPAGAGAHSIAVDLAVDAPRLWWPNGHGDQPLYTVSIRHPDVASARWSGRTGFRTARMVSNPGAPTGALPYTAEVNGRPVPMIGWNWAPADALHGDVTPDRVRHLVGLAAASGARLLRVWGGGLVETPDFYDACDEAGLLVWQELSQSSSGFQSAPATDQEFLDLMRAEAEAVVPPRRRHPSLLMWGGGNELDVDGTPAEESTSPVLEVLRVTIGRLDPGRHWVATSPTGPVFHNRLDVIEADPDAQHDVHGPWEHQGLEAHYRLYNAGTSLAHTEFGVEGAANARAFESVVPEDARWPLDRSNPVMRHLGEWWDNEPLVQEAFGRRLADAGAVRRASRLLQETGLRYAVEADRRRAPRCSMVLPWQLAESFPNAWCTAVVDHLGEPKPAYHGVARAFADDRVTLRVDRSVWVDRAPAAEAWLWSTGGIAAGSALRVRVLDHCGQPLGEWQWRDLPAVTMPVRLGTAACEPLPVADGAVLLWEAEWTAGGATLDRTVEVLTAGPDWSGLLDLPAATAVATVRRVAEHAAVVEVAHRSGPAAIGPHLADARPVEDDGYLRVLGPPDPLLPGRSRTYEVTWTPGVRPLLGLEGLNLAPLTIDPGNGPSKE